jgi:hypothetical protein
MTAEFVHVDVEAGPASEDGLSLRWKRADGGGERVVGELPYESEDGRGGLWRVMAADDAEGARTRAARAVLVEDSSDGVAWLVVGGSHGLVLEHAESGERVWEAYLLLARTTVIS